jgi:deoxyribodipyrimidine photo-lyase
MTPEFDRGLVWLRRDLRTDDHPALHAALSRCREVWVAFVLDADILAPLPRRDRRVAFILASLAEVDEALKRLSGQPQAGLIVRHAHAVDEMPRLAAQLKVQAVFAGRDDEPQALVRDAAVTAALQTQGIALHTVKDHVVFERQEVLTQMGKPYGVFTPYKNAWLKKIQEHPVSLVDITPLASGLAARPATLQTPVPSLTDIGFEPLVEGDLKIPAGMSGAQQLFEDFFERMDDYQATRDFPAIKGPSYLGVHFRFGTVSIRRMVSLALAQTAQGSAGAKSWLSELIWREFYVQILANFPHVATGAFRPEFDQIQWESGERAQALFAAWCEGRTGYPLVDAAMAQINQTGYMHNRLRMVAGSFLVKDLGIDWRWGERYFAEKLNDFDLSANNGGWQWVASSGCDAQPWFRIFNPVTQSEKFDPQGKFIRRYVPQLAEMSDKDIHAPWLAKPMALQAAGVTLGVDYPLPVVDHAVARDQTLARYGVLKKT